MLGAFVFFGTCALLIISLGVHEPRAGPIEILVYGICSALAAIMALAALWAFIRNLITAQTLVLGTTALELPPSPLSGMRKKSIAYTRITKLVRLKIGNGENLAISHTRGKVLIRADMLPSHAKFEELFTIVTERTDKACQR